MRIELFIRGLAIGFAVAAPVGPIGMLVIRRTLAEGRLMGLCTGLGAAAADAFYGAVGAFGLSFISSFLLGHAAWMKLLGGTFLCYLGIATFRTVPKEGGTVASGARHASAFLSTLLLTLANPLTILSFMAILASMGLGSAGDHGAAATVVAGVFVGSALWWLILSGVISLAKRRLGSVALGWINRISGLLLVAFGLMAIAGWAR